ncbi:MAG: type II toxin-antitoxin system MqsA family antitoxin [Anaerolineae bacterium]
MAMCPRCKSEALEPRTIRYTQEYKGRLYIIENVPAHVCMQCGEVILSEAVAEKIQRLVWSGAEPERTEQVPVYAVA